MKDKFINIEKGDCISLFTYGFDRLYVVTQIVKELNSHKVILFNAGSNSHMYFPCKRVEMSYGWDLKDMVNDFKKDFSIGIINCLCPKFNTKETIEFIKFLREDPDMKNKTFILIFRAKYGSWSLGKKLDYKYFNVYKKSILNYCNKHYSFYRSTNDCTDEKWTFEDLLNKTKKKYKRKDWDTNELQLANFKD